jgi:hypothetical protein
MVCRTFSQLRSPTCVTDCVEQSSLTKKAPQSGDEVSAFAYVREWMTSAWFDVAEWVSWRLDSRLVNKANCIHHPCSEGHRENQLLRYDVR